MKLLQLLTTVNLPIRPTKDKQVFQAQTKSPSLLNLCCLKVSTVIFPLPPTIKQRVLFVRVHKLYCEVAVMRQPSATVRWSQAASSCECF